MGRISNTHLKEFEASAIAADVIETRDYQTIINSRALPAVFTGKQRDLHGWIVPIRDVTGQIANYQIKPDNPRTDPNTGKPRKYETATGGRTCIDVPAAVVPLLRSPAATLWITEGSKKVDSGLSNGIACIVGLLGVDGWSSDGMALPDWKEIALQGRRVHLAFDSDVMTKASVRGALERLARYLTMHKAEVRYVLMPDLPDGSKCGLDDWFAAGGTVLDLEAYTVDVLPGSWMEWDPPIPLDPATGPPFPVDALPGIMGDLVAAVAEETQTPADLAALVALSVVSTAAGGKYVAYVDSSNWTEPVHTMMVPTAGPGNRKSGVFQRLTAPLRIWENERQEREASTIAEWESQEKVLEHRLRAAEQEEGKPPRKGSTP
jgi:hypothetical protein